MTDKDTRRAEQQTARSEWARDSDRCGFYRIADGEFTPDWALYKLGLSAPWEIYKDHK